MDSDSRQDSIELCVIGELYLDRDNKLITQLCPDDFMEPKAKRLFEFLDKYRDIRDDFPMLIEKIRMEKINPLIVTELTQSLEAAVALPLLQTHIDFLRDKTRRRKLIELIKDKDMLSDENIEIIHKLSRPFLLPVRTVAEGSAAEPARTLA